MHDDMKIVATNASVINTFFIFLILDLLAKILIILNDKKFFVNKCVIYLFCITIFADELINLLKSKVLTNTYLYENFYL